MARTYVSYDDAAAKCPFYQGTARQDVRCEGLTADGYVLLRFARAGELAAWRARYCDGFCYAACPVYGAIMLKYPGPRQNT